MIIEIERGPFLFFFRFFRLFAGSEATGQRPAALQSLLETARLKGIEPMAWLTDTLEKLPTWPSSRLDELLPLRKVSAV
jgi:hypothetical protein